MNREKGLYQQSADADPFCQMEKFIFVLERIGVLWEQLLLESLYLQSQAVRHTACTVTRKTENRSAAGIAAVVADTVIKRKLKRKVYILGARNAPTRDMFASLRQSLIVIRIVSTAISGIRNKRL